MTLRRDKMKGSPSTHPTSSSHSPRRSQWTDFLHHQQHHPQLPPSMATMKNLTPTSRTSSLRRKKALAIYGGCPYSSIDRNFYGTIDARSGQYKSPSRLLFESGYLNGREANHIYENLYNDPSRPRSGEGAHPEVSDSSDKLDDYLDDDCKYRSNLRDSVQLKSISHPPPPLPSSSSLPHHHRHQHQSSPRHNHPHHRDLDAVGHDDVDQMRDSPSSGFSMDRRLYKGSSKSDHQDDRLNHQVVIPMKESPTATKIVHTSLPDPRKVKKRPKKSLLEKLAEVDPTTRFQFIQSTLIICNLVAIFLGVLGLLFAGFLAPRPVRLDTFGGQLVIASIYMILTSLTGLYGSRRESITLLVTYGVMIIVSLFTRSVSVLVASMVSSSRPLSLSLSMMSGFLEVILIVFALSLATDVHLKKLERKAEKDRSRRSRIGGPSPAPEASSESSASSSSTTSDKEVLRRV